MNFEKDLETSSNSLSDGQGRQFEKNRRKNDYEDDFIADILEEGKLGDFDLTPQDLKKSSERVGDAIK